MMDALLVVHYLEDLQVAMPEVCRQLQRLGVRCRTVHDTAPTWKHRAWTMGRGAAVISFRPLEKFLPSWATAWHQVWLDKTQEYAELERARVPVPRWRALTETKQPDLSHFSPYVVVKPAVGAKGAMVRIMKRDRVQWKPLVIECLNRTSETMIVQEYIHTGERPMHYRVGTVFGEPIYVWRVEGSQARPVIDYDPATGTGFANGGAIVASAKGCTYHPEVPEDVIAFASDAHRRAFPTIPLLGFDVIRDANTGRLYVVDVNASGGTFNLQQVTQELHQVDTFTQFGGYAAVARGIHRRLLAETGNGHAHAV